MAIGTKFTGYTSIGTSTTATLLGGANLKLPDGAKEILGIFAFLTSPAGNTAAESVNGKIDVQSDDLRINPYTVFANPIGSSLLKSVAQVQGEAQFFPINCKCNGGEELKIYGQAQIAHTIAPYMGCLVVFTNQPTGKPQVFSKVSATATTGTAAARVASGSITITGGSRLVSIAGYAVGTTVAALKGLAGYFDLSSDDFTPSWLIHLPIEPISGQVDTNIQECVSTLGRKKVDIAIRSHCVINAGFTLSVALTTAGNQQYMVMYN